MRSHGRAPWSGHAHGREEAYARCIQRETARLRRLVDDLLDFGSLERGLIPNLTRVSVDVAQWIDAVAASERARCAAEGTALAIEVVDGGKGLGGGSVHERLFEPFERRSENAGTGLGLTIVRAIAEAHGGRATLDAGPGGRGAVALRASGYEVLEAADGVTGEAMALRDDPDLVLLDLMLPKRDGFSVLRHLRQDRLAVPIIMLTARGEEFDRFPGFDLGADDYVVKPFSMPELLGRVRALLARSSGGAPAIEGIGDRTRFGEIEMDFAAFSVQCAGRSNL